MRLAVAIAGAAAMVDVRASADETNWRRECVGMELAFPAGERMGDNRDQEVDGLPSKSGGFH